MMAPAEDRSPGTRIPRTSRAMSGLPAYDRPSDTEGSESNPVPTPAEKELAQGIPLADLRRGVIRVLSRWRDGTAEGDLGHEAELTDELIFVVEAVLDMREGREPRRLREDGLALRRRLLEVLQRELIQVWSQNETVRPSPDEMTRTLSAMEDLREELSPAWDERFGVELEGPSGLELAVEIAHDFRSPLSSILFLADTLREEGSGELNDLQKRQLNLMYAAALSMVSMAGDVVDLGRGRSRLREREPTQFSITEVLDSVRSIVEPMAHAKGLSLSVRAPDRDVRQGDVEALRRVLLNLTTNAIKFTSEGFVELSATEQGPGRVQFSVRDTGPGIRSGEKKDIYQTFRPFQGRSGFHFSGTGLGLTIARKLVRAMEGELEYETQKNLGTRFYFTIPLQTGERL